MKKNLWPIGLKQIPPEMITQLWPEIESSVVRVGEEAQQLR
jgi:hypothetical protein